MECLTGIGASILTKLAESTVDPVIRQVTYITNYNENLKELQTRVRDLVGAGESLKHAVEIEERKGKKIETEVQKWLSEVDRLAKEAGDLEEKHLAQTKCLHDFCPNPKLRHRLSRKSTKLVKEVVEHHGKKNSFDNIAYDAPLEEVCVLASQNYEAFDSRTQTVKGVIDELRKPDTYMIGVYGIGGVGKTTLVKQVYNQLAARSEKLFEEVVMVVDLKQNPSIERIQKSIAKKEQD